MLALRLARGAHPLVQLRRLSVAAASAGTGFLLLCTLGYAMGHPEASAGSVLRLVWCLAPIAATVYFAVAVARTDPGTRPRSGLAAIGLGPGRLMAYSAVTTALSTTLGSLLALVVFLYLRGDLTGIPFGGRSAEFLAVDWSLPLPAALTLLALVPLAASLAGALALRPKEGRPRRAGRRKDTPQAGSGADDTLDGRGADLPDGIPVPDRPAAPPPAPGGLPWGVAAFAGGLAVETYASRSGPAPGPHLPGGLVSGPAGVPAGWALTALGLALAAPTIAHLCGWLLQAVRPGAVRLLAGRGLQEEARRIGRPLGVVCAVASATYAAAAYAGAGASVGPLTTLGAVLVAGCTLATLATAAVEAKQARADTVAALVRLGAPATALRTAALLRVGALVAVFVPLTWAVAELAAMPLAG
ncbi:hypothetical protein ACFOZ0_18845 [Streptomyces yaanensis]|uniref:Integral membrane protein n=1 Tax=Streptomyces yaanensis TaxID=1142239 RepID=A0ABV7SGK1_9ACTN|nr:hypothetical protein [Streptomyces sp. CGMCC 4.7035]WNB98071.1 hypothetical protein Q2K21_08250 [Streptomyces sp. CGMCC 4.7035]